MAKIQSKQRLTYLYIIMHIGFHYKEKETANQHSVIGGNHKSNETNTF